MTMDLTLFYIRRGDALTCVTDLTNEEIRELLDEKAMGDIRDMEYYALHMELDRRRREK